MPFNDGYPLCETIWSIHALPELNGIDELLPIQPEYYALLLQTWCITKDALTRIDERKKQLARLSLGCFYETLDASTWLAYTQDHLIGRLK